MSAVGCCEPTASFGKWYVKMDTYHNPSYYLVNRQMPEHPRVCLQKDLVNTTASIYFDNEHQAHNAIQSYISFHSARGQTVQGLDMVVESVVESQVMEFI